jgi:hypothetical protein
MEPLASKLELFYCIELTIRSRKRCRCQDELSTLVGQCPNLAVIKHITKKNFTIIEKRYSQPIIHWICSYLKRSFSPSTIYLSTHFVFLASNLARTPSPCSKIPTQDFKRYRGVNYQQRKTNNSNYNKIMRVYEACLPKLCRLTSSEYLPFLAINSACVPCSTITP